jgi:protein-disulfide isomerase
MQMAKGPNVRQTPTLFVNGKPLQEFSPDGLAKQVASEVRAACTP